MKAEKAAAAVAVGVGDEWRCRRHPAARSGGGVCPYCLRDRLLRLCPNCARVRPCPCACASPSSSSSASGDVVGLVHSLIEREHRIARSRSVAASSSSAAAMASVAAGGVGGRRKSRIWGWTPFWKAAAREEQGREEGEALGLARSSSVSATAVEAKAVAAKARWGWHFPSPMKAFRHRRSSASMPERG